MAMTATYLTIDGEIVSETVDGVSRDYLTDSLGSVVGLIDENEEIVAKREYWPYGETRAESGDWTKSSFGYVGSQGYYDDSDGTSYIRFRILDRDQARWQTVDPLWPSNEPYLYVYGSPTTLADPSGLDAGLSEWCIHLNEIVLDECSRCYKCGSPSPSCQARCDYLANLYYNNCTRPRPPTSGWHPGPGGIVPIPVPRPLPPSPFNQKDCQDRCSGAYISDMNVCHDYNGCLDSTPAGFFICLVKCITLAEINYAACTSNCVEAGKPVDKRGFPIGGGRHNRNQFY